MRNFFLVLFLFPTALFSQTTQPYPTSQSLSDLASKAAHDAITQFEKENLKDDQLSITLIDLHDPSHITTGSYRGDTPYYPASVIKLFYLAATHQFLQDNKFPDSEQLQHGLQDMIVDSNNEATQYIVDVITDAPNGPDLPPDQWEIWKQKRNSVNRYFTSLGYTNINVCQKAYDTGPYGRDRLFLNGGKNRNQLTTDATARLLAEIALHKITTPDRCDQMLKLLHRDMTTPPPKSGEDQSHTFTALALDPAKDHLWSKAGWTNTARHDAAYIERPDGTKLIITTFTFNHANQKQIIPSIAKSILAGIPTASEK